jgi:hypothetical protein
MLKIIANLPLRCATVSASGCSPPFICITD